MRRRAPITTVQYSYTMKFSDIDKKREQEWHGSKMASFNRFIHAKRYFILKFTFEYAFMVFKTIALESESYLIGIHLKFAYVFNSNYIVPSSVSRVHTVQESGRLWIVWISFAFFIYVCIWIFFE